MDRGEGVRKNFWEKAGGASDYNAEWKEKVLHYMQKVLARQGVSMGDSILDLGSGVRPVSRFIAPDESKVIYVDFNAPDPAVQHPDSLHIAKDIPSLIDSDSFAAKRSLVESARFLGKDPRQESSEHIDTVIVSDLLNYVPAAAVLTRAYEYLKPGGILIVLNQPGRTFEHAGHSLDPEGISNNDDLISILEDDLHMTALHTDITKDKYFIGAYQKADEASKE